MSQQIQISGGAKVRDLQDVIIGTSGVLSSLAFNVANGVPKLDVNGKILVSQLPNSVMEYKGVWNAATNTPTLVNGTGNQGDVYLCNVAGTVNFGAGPIAFVVGDQVIYSGSIWQRASGATGTVTSVALTESGDSLNITGSPITTSGTINIGFNGTNLQYVNGAGNLTTFPTLITSIGLSMPSAFSVANSPLTANGTIAVTGAGVASQYIRGDGTLANFPTSGGGGSSVAYYFNSSVSQGTLGGVAYRELSKVPIIGAGTDITIATNGYIANYITDAGDPSLLEIPAGNWNFEMFFSASSGGGSPSFYVELYKYDGTTFTLISSSSATPEGITNGTAIDLYTTALAVPLTTLTLTDRLAIRVYVNNSGRTITLHTENSHLCEVITTFSTGIAALNGLTAQVQYFQVGTSGTDFNISSTTATHTFNLPTASAANRGALSSADWTIFNGKQPQLNGTGFVKASGTTITYDNSTYYLASNPSAFIALTALSAGTGISYNNTTGVITNSAPDQVVALTASTGISVTGTYPNFTITNTSPSSGGTVTSVAMTVPTGLSVSGSPITTSGTLAVSLASGYSIPTTASQTNWDTAYTNRITSATAPLSIISNVIAMSEASGSVDGFLSRFDWTTFNNKQGTITLTTTGTSGAATFTSNTLNIPQYQAAGTYVNGVSGTSPISSTGGTAPDISISQSDASTSGYLSSTDWNTFNNKLSNAGSTGYIPKFAASNSLNNSGLYDDGTTISLISRALSGTSAYFTSLIKTDSAVAFQNITSGGTAPSSLAGYSQLFFDTYQFAIRKSDNQSVTFRYPATAFSQTYDFNVEGYLTAQSTASLTTGSVMFANSVGKITQNNANFFWDDTNNRLGIGTGSPTDKLVIQTTSGTNTGLALQRSANTDWLYYMLNPTGASSASNVYWRIGMQGSSNNFNIWTDNGTSNDSRLIITNGGNLGLGVTPSAGGLSGYVLFELANGGASIYSGPNQNLNGSNISWSGGTASYKISNFATLYNQQSGQHQWYTAPSGTAGNAITFTQAMTLTAAGRLLINTPTESTYQLDVNGTGRFSGDVTLGASATPYIGNNIFLRGRNTANTAYKAIIGIGSSGGSAPDKIFIDPDNNGSYFGGAATFSSSVTAGTRIIVSGSMILGEIISSYSTIETTTGNGIWLRPAGGSDPIGLKIATTGAATFSSTLGIGGVADSVKSGTYTPTINTTTNIASSSVGTWQYLRVGNTVTVSGSITITPTLAVSTTSFNFSLPINSTFATGNDCAGTGVDYNATTYLMVNGNSGAANFGLGLFKSTTTSAMTLSIQFTYQII